MNSDRRQFLTHATALGCGVAFGRLPVATGHPALNAAPTTDTQLAGKSLFSKMKWFNEPASAKQTGDQLLVTTKPKTDYWRKTFYEYVTDNGHLFYLSVTGDFTLECRVAGKYAALYDQAGLMVRIDSSNWLNAGSNWWMESATPA